MNFAQPYWLLVGLFACIGLGLLFRFLQKKRLAALEKFASHHLLGSLTRNVSGSRRRYKNFLLLLAVFLCFAALARPQFGFQWVEVKRKGIDLLFALDTSKSMLAEDIKPNRLTRAHLAILDFVRQLDGDRVGLLPFAGSAYLMCPLTLDYDAFESSLAAVNTDIIPHGGTNIGAVISQAVETLNNAANHKILIILTDGENLQGDVIKEAEAAAKQGLTIYTVGVGTSQGELIPVAGGSGQGFIKDKEGNFVTSRLDEKTLSAIAETSGGLYVPLGPAGEGLETVYQKKLSLIPKEELAERRHKVPLERFEWPLAAALLILAVELLVGERKKARRIGIFKTLGRLVQRVISLSGSRRGKTAAILLIMLFGLGNRAYCSTGEEAFARGDYVQASEYYQKRLDKSPEDPQLQYNYGTAAYKNNMFDEAAEAFTKALKSDDVKLQEKAYYNRGNSQYQKGQESQQADPKATIEQWHKALDSLQAAMNLDPKDADARHNHELIKKRLEELEKKQQQNKKDQQNGKDQQDKKDGKDKEQKGDSQDQQQDQGSAGQQKQQQEGRDRQQDDSDQQNKQPQKEQQDQGKKQQSAAAEKEDGKSEQAEAINEQQKKSDSAEQAKQDAKRQQLGKMTREEAESLLNALKNEEGELNFVPSGHNNNADDIDKDW